MRWASAALVATIGLLTACPAPPPSVAGEESSSTSGGNTSQSVNPTPGTDDGATTDDSVDAELDATSTEGLPSSTASTTSEDSGGSNGPSQDGSSTSGEHGAEDGTDDESTETSGGDPEPDGPAWAFQGGQATPEVGGPNTVPAFDLCPFQHVLVGLKTWISTDPESVRNGVPLGIAGLCARAYVEGDTLRLERSTTLIRHGIAVAAEMEVDVRCPDGHAVVGLGGSVGTYMMNPEPGSPTVNYLDAVTLTCAPVTGTATEIQLGTPMDLAPVGMVDAPRTLVPPNPCGAGMVARGLHIYSGHWVDALALYCSTPRNTAPTGASCESGLACTSGSCQENACTLHPCPADCTCAVYEGHDYAFCDPVGEDFDASVSHCMTIGTTLGRIDDAVENAWLASTSHALDIEVLRLGGHDRDVEGTWLWQGGDPFWMDGPYEGRYTAWYEEEPDNLGDEGEDCLELFPDGRWSDHICEEAIPFLCELPLPPP